MILYQSSLYRNNVTPLYLLFGLFFLVSQPLWTQVYISDFVGISRMTNDEVDNQYLFGALNQAMGSPAMLENEQYWNPVWGSPWVLVQPIKDTNIPQYLMTYISEEPDTLGPFVEQYYMLPKAKPKKVRFLSENNWGDVSDILSLREKYPSKKFVFSQDRMNGAQLIEMFRSFLSKDTNPIEVVSITENSVQNNPSSRKDFSHVAYAQIAGLLIDSAKVNLIGIAPEEAFLTEKWRILFGYLEKYFPQGNRFDNIRFWQEGFRYATDIFSPYAAIPDIVFDEKLGFGEDIGSLYGARFRKMINDGTLKSNWPELSLSNQTKIKKIVEQAQANWIIRTYLEVAAANLNGDNWMVDKVFYHRLVDSDIDFCGLLEGQTKDYHPKKSWYWVQTLRNVLGDFYFYKDISPEFSSAEIRAFQFLSRKGEKALVLWSPSASGREIIIDIDLQRIGFDLMDGDIQMVKFQAGKEFGERVAVTLNPDSGLATVAVNETPIILTSKIQMASPKTELSENSEIYFTDVGWDSVRFYWTFPKLGEHIGRQCNLSLFSGNSKEPMVVRQVDLNNTNWTVAKMGFNHLQPDHIYRVEIEYTDTLFSGAFSRLETAFKTLPLSDIKFITLSPELPDDRAVVKWKSKGYTNIIVKDGVHQEGIVWKAIISATKTEYLGSFSNVQSGLFSVELIGKGKESVKELFMKLEK